MHHDHPRLYIQISYVKWPNTDSIKSAEDRIVTGWENMKSLRSLEYEASHYPEEAC